MLGTKPKGFLLPMNSLPLGFSGGATVKNLPPNAGDAGLIPG